MKVTVDYNPDTGEIKDGETIVCIAPSHWAFSEQATNGLTTATATTTKDLTSLKDAGFTAQEIMQMKREGLV